MYRYAPMYFLILLFLSTPCLAFSQDYSDLWGKSGDKWHPKSRLPDFSYSGYHRGESTISIVPIVANVMDFGAMGDGENDDSQPFIDAIASSNNGAIFIPPGRYKITKILLIQKSNVVLRGAGPEKSILFFPTPLHDIKPDWARGINERHTSNYSWSGGMVWLKGDYRSDTLTDITSQARRGETVLTVTSTQNLKVGDRVEIFIEDDKQKTLTDYLYSGAPGNITNFTGSTCSFVVTLTNISPKKIFFDRPLRFDIRPAWTPQVRRFSPTVREVGIEELSFEFPESSYNGHFSERGYNALALTLVSDSWVRNIKILHADSGIFTNSTFCTISGVSFESNRVPYKSTTGHHGILLGGNDNLFTNFRFETNFIHDLGVSKNHSGNVFSNGSGIDLNFDHHRRAPYENLFTNIHLGKGTRMWRSGGGKALGKHCGARSTFWNIRAAQPQKYPDNQFGPSTMNMVAIQTNQPSIKNILGTWFEAISPNKIEPKNLHTSQLKRRIDNQFKFERQKPHSLLCKQSSANEKLKSCINY